MQYVFGSYKLKMTCKQLQFCILCALQLISVGSRREEANGTQETLQETVVQKLPLRCIVWEAGLTFMTVGLSGVKNPDDKCVLAIKMCSKTKETVCLSNIICILCVQRSTSLTAEGRQL